MNRENPFEQIPLQPADSEKEPAVPEGLQRQEGPIQEEKPLTSEQAAELLELEFETGQKRRLVRVVVDALVDERIGRTQEEGCMQTLYENRKLIIGDIRSQNRLVRNDALVLLRDLMRIPIRELERVWEPQFSKSSLPQKQIEVPLALKYGMDLAEEVLPELESLLKIEEPQQVKLRYLFSVKGSEAKPRRSYFEASNWAMDVLSELAEKGDSGQSRKSVEVLVRALGAIRDGFDNEYLSSHSSFFHAIKAIVKRGEVEEKILAAETLIAAARANREKPHYATLLGKVAEFCFGGTKMANIFFEDIAVSASEEVSAGIRRYDLPPNEMLSAWVASGPLLSSPEYVRENIDQMRVLESASPGICKFLFDEFGIADFARYPEKMLLQQREQFEDRTKPYGVIIYPRNDWNGAFYHGWSSFLKLHNQLGGDFYLRVVECESKIDIARALIKLDRRYNPADGSGHKISLAIIGGHGTQNNILFGGSKARHKLRAEDFIGKGVRRASKFFKSGATFILASCSTGIDKGIAQELSKKFGARVIAPREPVPVSMHFLANKQQDGTWEFDAAFYDIRTQKKNRGLRAEYNMGTPK